MGLHEVITMRDVTFINGAGTVLILATIFSTNVAGITSGSFVSFVSHQFIVVSAH
jgi:hypothetical protein